MYTGNYDETKVDRILDYLYDEGFAKVWISNGDISYDAECEFYTDNGGDMIIPICFYTDDEIESPDYWSNQLYEYAQDFDPLAEAMLWVDETGRGINGAPGTVITLYEGYCDWAEDLMRIASGVGQL